jgi:hypothetical protein
MTFPTKHDEWYSKANQRSRRVAEGNRKRIRRRQRERERERLLRVGADPAWVERVLGGNDGLAA